MKRRLITFVGVAITVVSLWWAFRGLDFSEIAHTLSGVNLLWVIPIFGSTLVSIWFRAIRWKIMLDPIRSVTQWQAYNACMIGFMANNVLPMRLGEVVRAYVIGRDAGISKTSAFATIIAERAFDLAILLLIMGGLLLQFSFDATFRVLGYTALGACLLMFMVMGVVHLRHDLAMRILNLFLRPFPSKLRVRGRSLIGRFLAGFEVLGRGQRILQVSFWSVMVWLAAAFGFHFAIMAFGLELPLPAALVMMVVCALGIMIPSSPGFIGTFELAAIFGLTLFKSADRVPLVSEEVAASYAVFYHAIQFIPLTILGMWHLWRSKVTLAKVMDMDGDA